MRIFFVKHYGHDGIGVEGSVSGRPMAAEVWLRLGFLLLVTFGWDLCNPPLLSARKTSDWDTYLEGWVTSLTDDCMTTGLAQMPCWLVS